MIILTPDTNANETNVLCDFATKHNIQTTGIHYEFIFSAGYGMYSTCAKCLLTSYYFNNNLELL